MLFGWVFVCVRVPMICVCLSGVCVCVGALSRPGAAARNCREYLSRARVGKCATVYMSCVRRGRRSDYRCAQRITRSYVQGTQLDDTCQRLAGTARTPPPPPPLLVPQGLDLEQDPAKGGGGCGQNRFFLARPQAPYQRLGTRACVLLCVRTCRLLPSNLPVVIQALLCLFSRILLQHCGHMLCCVAKNPPVSTRKA